MEERDLLEQIGQILEAAAAPLLAREITEELKQRGINVERSTVNSALYRRSQLLLVKDGGHRWSALWSQALQIVDAANTPLLAREITLELNRCGFKIDRTQVNKSLYRTTTQNFLVKGDDHRWSRGSRRPRDSPSPRPHRDTPLAAGTDSLSLGASSNSAASRHAPAGTARTSIASAVAISVLIVVAIIAFTLLVQ